MGVKNEENSQSSVTTPDLSEETDNAGPETLPQDS